MLTGGCQCGALRYEADTAPLGLYVCHCAECRRQSASAFGISVIIDAAAFRLVRGTAKCWERGADSGRRLACWFCPDCGGRLWHDGRRGTVSIKGGTLDAPPDLSRAVHIWTLRKLPGVAIPEGAVSYPEEPPD